VNSGERVRVIAAKVLGDGAAPVAAVRAVARVAQFARHQLIPQIGDAESTAAIENRIGERISGQARYDDVERVSGIGRIGQQRNQLREAQERIGKAVREHDRQRLVSLTALVDEVDVHALQASAKMLKVVDARLLRPPVEAGLPVL